MFKIKSNKSYYTNNADQKTLNRIYACKSNFKVIAYLRVWLVVQCHKYLASMLNLEGCDDNTVGRSAIIQRLPLTYRFLDGKHYVMWYGDHCKNYPDEVLKSILVHEV